MQTIGPKLSSWPTRPEEHTLALRQYAKNIAELDPSEREVVRGWAEQQPEITILVLDEIANAVILLILLPMDFSRPFLPMLVATSLSNIFINPANKNMTNIYRNKHPTL